MPLHCNSGLEAGRAQKMISRILKAMRNSLNITRDNFVVKIAGALEIAGSELLRQRLIELLREEAPLVVDLSGVQACDTSALQLLCSARKSADRAGKPLSFEGVPEVVTATAAAIGLADFDQAVETSENAAAAGKGQPGVR